MQSSILTEFTRVFLIFKIDVKITATFEGILNQINQVDNMKKNSMKIFHGTFGKKVILEDMTYQEVKVDIVSKSSQSLITFKESCRLFDKNNSCYELATDVHCFFFFTSMSNKI